MIELLQALSILSILGVCAWSGYRHGYEAGMRDGIAYKHAAEKRARDA